MKKIALVTILFLCAAPVDGWTFRDHRPSLGSPAYGEALKRINRTTRARFKRAVQTPVVHTRPEHPAHPIYPGRPPDHPGHKRYPYLWPVTSTVVRETPTVIIVTPPPEEPALPPEPQHVWVPPVMDTRTEPGYWDYGVKKVWMGDHWRFEQDAEVRTWVPPSQVTYVKQAGYWKVAD